MLLMYIDVSLKPVSDPFLSLELLVAASEATTPVTVDFNGYSCEVQQALVGFSPWFATKFSVNYNCLGYSRVWERIHFQVA